MKAILDLDTGEVTPIQSTKKKFICWWEYNWKEIIEQKVFTLQEEGVLHRLGTYISFNDNTIRKTDKTPYNKKEISELLGLQYSRTRKVLESLKQKNALLEQKEGKGYKYIISPYLCWKGTEKDKAYRETQMLFKNKIKTMRNLKTAQSLVRVRGRPIPIVILKDHYSRGKGSL